jgi:conjugal transfer mating pair stabilization protein TraG
MQIIEKTAFIENVLAASMSPSDGRIARLVARRPVRALTHSSLARRKARTSIMVEIFTVGGGEYLVNVFQAVAAWTGNGGYKSLIQVTMVMGLALSVIVLAFNQDWRAWLNWFLGATLIYMCLMVPRIDVHVTDRSTRAWPRPMSQRAARPRADGELHQPGRRLSDRSAELVFGLPGDLNYSKNGMIYGARLYDATRSLRISDPEFAANLDEHVRQCVFYDLLLGRYSMKQLAESDDIWATIAPGSAGAGPEVPDPRQADDSVTLDRHLPRGL